ncbi:PKD-like domain-containing protein [Mucilaginibacter sp.]|uniref:Ig-like domain-containing protein n=1 Tax=Mucilaginibacter sp. TaxID=1882438 RepID=UPI002600D992|nr:PKD-like domain-containing protein [Mucilaginibacter sp.]
MRNYLLVLVCLLLSLSGYSQCAQGVNVSASNTSICSGNSVLLTATPSGGNGPFTYVWSNGASGPTTTVNKEGTYSVTVTSPGCPGVSGNITISVGVSPNAPTVTGNTLVCPGTSATLTASGPGGAYQWYDAPTGGTFLFSGDTYVTPAINSGITFYVQTTINGCPSLRTPVFVNATGNPTVKDATVCFGNGTTLTASGGSSYEWYSSASGGSPIASGANFVTPPLTTSTIYYVVAVISGCTSARTPVNVTVTPAPQTPVVQGTSVCAGSKASLHATPGPGIFAWYDVPSGGTALILSPDYTTPPLNVSTTYYVENSINNCVSSRVPVTVTVTPIPAAPGDQIQTTCKGSSILLTASASPPATGTYEWYDLPAGGTLLQTGLTYQTPVLNSTTTYYVLYNNGGCTSARSKVTVVINPPPAAPSVAGAIICNGSTTTLTATGPGGSYQWFDVASGGVPLFTGTAFTTPALTVTTKYYVQTTISGCVSPRKAVTVTVTPVVNPPSAANTSTCSGSPASLTASGSTGTYQWYDAATGGTQLATGQAYTTPPLITTTTYYVQTTVNGCTSARKAVTVTINPVPTAPTASGTNVCSGSKATLTATAASGSIEWYDAPAAGNRVKIGPTFITPALIATTTYYVQSVAGSCISSRTPVTVTVGSTITPQFKYPAGSVCSLTPGTIAPTIFEPAGGTFSASPAGLIIDPTTGAITISSSTPGIYTITFVGKGSCSTPEKARFKIFTVANSSFSYSSPNFCQDAANPLPNFGLLGSGGNFTATPAGLVINSATGEIDLKKSIPQKYTVTNTITATGGCSGSTSSTDVTVEQAATVSAGPDQTVTAGSAVQLAGTVSGVPKGTWSGGTGSFSNTTIPNPVYTPGAGELSATLTFTSDDPAGSCGPKSDKMTITFKNGPFAPTVTGNSTCLGSSANLSAIAPGGTYKWYDALVAGNLLFTGANFTTPVLMVNTTYYVEAVNSLGVTSPRTTVLVTVNNIPAAPVVPPAPICAGNTAILIPADLTGNFEWYDAAAGGNLLSKNSTYTTPALTTNQTYYVQVTINGCTSPRTQVDVTVSALPNVTSASTGTVCSGNALNYTITADIAAATFLWSRAAVAGISNAPAANQSSNTITEILLNTSGAAVNVAYIITPINNGCQGTPFKYAVTVYPTPIVTSGQPPAICNEAPVNYDITFNTAADFEWSRAAVPGITNAAVSGQNTATIRETLINTTDAPIVVKYIITSQTLTCTGIPFELDVTVNPSVKVTSADAGEACSNVPQNYVISSNIPSATYIWSRLAVPGITNPTVTNQTSSTITETLVNHTPVSINVYYAITPFANGCPGKSFTLAVFVHPQPDKPVANTNAPICVGSTLQLRTGDVAGGAFMWTGPNGYSSTDQNPDIPNASVANTGVYSLTVTVNGCSSEVSTTQLVEIRTPGLANAGPDQIVCITDPEIILAGTVKGGRGTGIWSSHSTNAGTFSSLTDLNAHYKPSQDEKNDGQVTFTLTSTSDDNCTISTDDVTVFFGPLPAVKAGPDQAVCEQTPTIQLAGSPILAGTQAQWTSTGPGGSFTPSATDYNANYLPSAADVKAGFVNLVLHVTNPGPCQIETDTMKITFIPPAKVTAEKLRYVLRNRTITLHPNVSDNNVQYLWTPNIDISDNKIKNPIITGIVDRTYTLTVTDSRGCVSSDSTMVKVSPEVVVPNTFTPNSDGVNDLWNIQGLIAYTEATVDIFTRYGQKVYHSIGYDKPWDGIYNGKQLPVGVYYYVIDTKLFNQVLSGNVTLIR